MPLSRTTRALAAGLAAGALAAPSAALAMPAPLDPVPTETLPAQAPVVRVVDQGFDWGSAAVGAGGTGVLIALVSLGSFGYASRTRTGTVR
jgi:hypothetical protein